MIIRANMNCYIIFSKSIYCIFERDFINKDFWGKMTSTEWLTLIQVGHSFATSNAEEEEGHSFATMSFGRQITCSRLCCFCNGSVLAQRLFLGISVAGRGTESLQDELSCTRQQSWRNIILCLCDCWPKQIWTIRLSQLGTVRKQSFVISVVSSGGNITVT